MKDRARGKGKGRARRRGARVGGKSREKDGERAHMWAMTGDKVEVRSDEEGFIGAWYEAEVVHLESRSTCVVEYEQLLSDDGFPLQEIVLLSNLRPRPPLLSHRSSWLQGHLVEAYDRDGWWAGVVLHPLPERDLVFVRFRTTCEELPFHPSLLRGLQNWENGVWTNLTQAGRPDEDHYMDAIDIDNSSSPVHHTEPPRKRGRPRKNKLLSVDLPSRIQEEESQVMEPDRNDDQILFTDAPVEALKSHKRLYGCGIPSMEESQTPASANDHSASAVGAVTYHPDCSTTKSRLELEAYQSLVKALRLKGPLNWNQERLLADVRLHLNITNAEQTLVLKALMPANDGR